MPSFFFSSVFPDFFLFFFFSCFIPSFRLPCSLSIFPSFHPRLLPLKPILPSMFPSSFLTSMYPFLPLKSPLLPSLFPFFLPAFHITSFFTAFHLSFFCFLPLMHVVCFLLSCFPQFMFTILLHVCFIFPSFLPSCHICIFPWIHVPSFPSLLSLMFPSLFSCHVVHFLLSFNSCFLLHCFLINIILFFSVFWFLPLLPLPSSFLIIVFQYSLISIPVYFLSSPSFLPSLFPSPSSSFVSCSLLFSCFSPFISTFILSYQFDISCLILSSFLPSLFTSFLIISIPVDFLSQAFLSSLPPVLLFFVVVLLPSYLPFSFLPSLPPVPVRLMISFRSTDGCNSCMKKDSRHILSETTDHKALLVCTWDRCKSRSDSCSHVIQRLREVEREAESIGGGNNSGWLRPLSYILLTDQAYMSNV